METEPVESGDLAPKHSIARRVIGFVIGVVLLGVALWVVMSNQDAVRAALASARDASVGMILAAALLPLAHWVCTSLVFWLMMRRFGVVKLGEMHLLIGAAGLLNFLPMRPGMFGRIAYHKTVNGIRLHDSVRVTVECMILTAVANGVAIGAALLALGSAPTLAWITVASPTAVMIGAGLLFTKSTGSILTPPSSFAWALAARYVDTLAWVWRYAIAFSIIGQPITPAQAAIFAGGAQLAMMVPFVGSGLGVREWGIGLAFPLFYREAARATGLTGDLLNRATEVLVAVPVGLVCLAILARQQSARKSESAS